MTNLIQNYCHHNGIKKNTQKSNDDLINIPIYVQQLFYHLVQSMRKQTNVIFINLSEYNLLNDSLRAELISFDTEEERKAESVFEKAILNVSEQCNNPQIILKRLKAITDLTENILTDELYCKLDVSNASKPAIDFLKGLGFEYTIIRVYS